MIRRSITLAAAGIFALALTACHDDKPHEYGEQRPDINQLSEDDRGLQSKDVEAATAQMIQDLLALPALNTSPTQWTLVVEGMQDMTTDRMTNLNYDIFTESLRSAISEKGQGRIQLIENKDAFHGLRDKELEGGAPDPYGQGGAPGNPAPGAINPDFILYGKALDMPNRSTNFYMLQFNVFNARNRAQVFSRSYKVKVLR
jgi:hypothetical protein